MKKTYVIAGAGFRGFCDAMELLKNPDNTVHIIDPAPFFGGIAYSREVKGFSVDKGVHVFDSVPVALGDIVNEIMDGQTREIEFVSASAFNKKVTEGYSLPDLSSLDEQTKSKIKADLAALVSVESKEDEARNLSELFYAKFGPTAGDIFSRIFEKVYSIHPKNIEKTGLSVTSLHRLKFLGDDEMNALKQSSPFLDSVLAARRKSMDKIDDFVSIYPDTGEAMKGWCDRAAKWLEAKGAIISLGENIESIEDTPTGVVVKTSKKVIEATQVIWSNDNISPLAKALGFEFETKSYQHGTPMMFATFITDADKIRDFTYLQNFDPDGLTYRSAAAGLFSNQITKDGRSFITCECPSVIGSDAWNNPEGQVQAIWGECRALGVVANDARMLDHEIINIPATFKPPKIGYKERIQEFHEELPKYSERVLLRTTVPFFRREIYLDSLNLPDMVA